MRNERVDDLMESYGKIRSRLTWLGRIMRVVLLRTRRRFRQWLRPLPAYYHRRQALLWQRLYHARYRAQVQFKRHSAIAAVILVILVIGVIPFWLPVFQDNLEPFFDTDQKVQALRSLFLAVGAALLGAVTIISSFVLFSMQVNIERMPHGLFRRLSTDLRLLSIFATTFLLAVVISALSIFPDKHWIGAATAFAIFGTLMILVLFLIAYRRALSLINPIRQLNLVVSSARKEFQVWERRAKRAAPLFVDLIPPPHKQNDPFAMKHDLARVAYFQANPYWTDNAKQAVGYAISFARHYAEQRDHEVGAAALNAIVAINLAYVEAKGKTFFTNELMFDNPLSSDALINDTLEHLRQTTQIGISRGDEQQIEQTLRAFAVLTRIYAAIDYNRTRASKTHAHLAAFHLTSEVKHVVPHNMPEVLMEGARLIGQCADILLGAEGPEGIRTLTQELGGIACCGVAREDHRPVTLTCVEQLARLSFNILRTSTSDIRFVAEDIRSSMALIVKLFLIVPDTPLAHTHSTFLGPWYSATSTQALSGRLTELVNAVADAKAGDSHARQVIHNIESWADGMYRTEKELLLEAVKMRSQFTFDMIEWIRHVTRILLALSNTAACDAHTQAELRKHALWLISVLSFVPHDVETVKFIESFRMTETFFEVAQDAHSRNCPELAASIGDLLVSWMFKGGQYFSGWAILEHSIYGLAVLALLAEFDGAAIAKLKADIGKRLAAGGLPDQEVRDSAAIKIRGRAATLYRGGHWSSSIESGVAQADHVKLKPLLVELADLISPETVGQALKQHF